MRVHGGRRLTSRAERPQPRPTPPRVAAELGRLAASLGPAARNSLERADSDLTAVIMSRPLSQNVAPRVQSLRRYKGYAMKTYVTVGLTVLAGAALLETALIPGLLIGGVAVLAPRISAERRSAQPAPARRDAGGKDRPTANRPAKPPAGSSRRPARRKTSFPNSPSGRRSPRPSPSGSSSPPWISPPTTS